MIYSENLQEVKKNLSPFCLRIALVAPNSNKVWVIQSNVTYPTTSGPGPCWITDTIFLCRTIMYSSMYLHSFAVHVLHVLCSG